jgi:hypothetical protein
LQSITAGILFIEMNTPYPGLGVKQLSIVIIRGGNRESQ